MKNMIKVTIAAAIAATASVALAGFAGAMDINGDLGAYLQDAGKVKVAAPEAVRASVKWDAKARELPGGVIRYTWTAADAPAVVMTVRAKGASIKSFRVTVDGQEIRYTETAMIIGPDTLTAANGGKNIEGTINGERVTMNFEIKSVTSIPDVFASVKARIKSPSGEAVMDMTQGFTLTGSLTPVSKKAAAYAIAIMESSIIAAAMEQDALDAK